MSIDKIEFCGRELVAEKENETVMVALKPICDALGLDWSRQLKMVKGDPVLFSVVGELPTTGADGKQYEMLCLPLDYLNGWLFKVSAKRYTGARREAIILYQKECYRVLADHFQKPASAAETLRIITDDFGPQWVLERLQTADVLERFYAPRTQLGEVSINGEEHATIRRAANPVKGGHRPTPRERAYITQPSLFGWTALRKIGRAQQ